MWKKKGQEKLGPYARLFRAVKMGSPPLSAGCSSDTHIRMSYGTGRSLLRLPFAAVVVPDSAVVAPVASLRLRGSESRAASRHCQ